MTDINWTKEPGHLFLIRGDIDEIYCDEQIRPAKHGGPKHPCTVKSYGPSDQVLDAIREKVSRVAEEVRRKRPMASRQVLIALPALGLGEGGQSSPDYPRLLLETLVQAARSACCDIVLVLRSKRYAELQRIRLHGREYWPEDRQDGTLKSLVQSAQKGKLALLLGAGVSQAAGLPSWSGLIEEVAKKKGVSDDLLKKTSGWDLTDVAWLLEQERFGGRQKLIEAVAGVLDKQTKPSLLHYLLANLPTSQMVTTNYDQLFEDACKAEERPLQVIPYDKADHRWLLKLHGCLRTVPSKSEDREATEGRDDLVLTRKDYLRYDERRTALAGVVSSLLFTHHMLVVGFSLSDPNFTRIAYQTRLATPPTNRGTSTDRRTVLVPWEDVREQLWTDEFNWRFFGAADEVDRAAAPRRQAIFLDRLAATLADVTLPQG